MALARLDNKSVGSSMARAVAPDPIETFFGAAIEDAAVLTAITPAVVPLLAKTSTVPLAAVNVANLDWTCDSRTVETHDLTEASAADLALASEVHEASVELEAALAKLSNVLKRSLLT